MAMIFTTKGDIEESLLTKKEGGSETATEVIHWQEYYLGEELVKREVQMHLKYGLTGEGATAGF